LPDLIHVLIEPTTTALTLDELHSPFRVNTVAAEHTAFVRRVKFRSQICVRIGVRVAVAFVHSGAKLRINARLQEIDRIGLAHAPDTGGSQLLD
jgi:hypothetical protein